MIGGKIIKLKSFVVLVMLCLTFGFVLPQKTQAQHDDYPKLANYYLAWDITNDQAKQLAKWDVVILSPQAQERNPSLIPILRQNNPNIKILAYVPTQEITHDTNLHKESKFWREIYNKANQNNWWLRDGSGNNISWWPANWIINASSAAPKTNGQNWADYLPELVNNEFLKSDQWDGIFFDNLWSDLSWLNKPIDINGDGSADSDSYADQRWQEGLNSILIKTRQLAPNKIIVGNAKNNAYSQNLNGQLRETFPLQNEANWTGGINEYLSANLGHNPKFYIINTNTLNTGNQADYKNFRYGLTSTLLGEGYYSFDHGDQAHESLWWYDEYDFFLGRSLSEIENLLDPNSKQIKPGVWQRDFQNALVLVNSTGTEQKITLDQEFEKIKGTQDTKTNNGAVVRSVTLKPYDGIILLRRVGDIKSAAYFNGSFVRVFNKYGDSVRQGFFVYERQYKGGHVVAKQDIDSNGSIETIVADERKITIYDINNNVIRSFYPYGQNYNLGINFAVNDFENDGFYEIVTGTMRGWAPEVKTFNYLGEQVGKTFNAYHPGYLGGVNVAFCDTNGNTKKEIVVGAGYLGGPQVRIFDINGRVLSGGFFAYHPNFRGGVNVACGDIDGNGIDEIVTGAGFGGSSHVRYFDSKFKPLSPGFWAFGEESRTGVRTIVADLDNDGIAEILAASPDVFTTSFTNINY